MIYKGREGGARQVDGVGSYRTPPKLIFATTGMNLWSVDRYSGTYSSNFTAGNGCATSTLPFFLYGTVS